jgi:hypothetical protein
VVLSLIYTKVRGKEPIIINKNLELEYRLLYFRIRISDSTIYLSKAVVACVFSQVTALFGFQPLSHIAFTLLLYGTVFGFTAYLKGIVLATAIGIYLLSSSISHFHVSMFGRQLTTLEVHVFFMSLLVVMAMAMVNLKVNEQYKHYKNVKKKS